MGYKYTKRDGQRVEVAVAAAFDKLAAAFHRKFGQTLHVTEWGGTRTRAQQEKLYADYKAGRGNLAAVPGTSNHEEDGPIGPRALDVHDSGKDDGVTVAGTTRGKWLKANAHRYGFNPAGYGFNPVEPWHIEFTGKLGETGKTAPKYPLPKGWYFGPKNPVSNEASVSGYYGHRDDLKRWQERMHDRGWNIAADGLYGPQTRQVAVAFQKEKHLQVDGLIGPETWKAAWTEPVT